MNSSKSGGPDAGPLKLGIMQPYVFPYLGYFQLLGYVNRFVIYDDVDFIKQGWINRNNILVAHKPHMFSIPLLDPSSFRRIDEIQVHRGLYGAWLRKFLMTIDQNYRRAPFYEPIRGLLVSVFEGFEGSIGGLANRSIVHTASYLGIQTEIVETSRRYANQELKGKNRVIDICLKEHASEYVNAVGGRALYHADDFNAHGITLHFLCPRPVTYPQFTGPFVPGLSIIDVMMFTARPRICELLKEFDLK